MTDPTTHSAAAEASSQELLARAFSRRNFLRYGLGTAAVLSPAFIAACGGSSSSTTNAAAAASGGSTTGAVQSGGSLLIASEYQVQGLDPAAADGAASINVWLSMYDTLFDTSTPASLAAAHSASIKGAPPAPMLAKSWESSKDQKTWKITLQPNAKSAAGNPLTADDVVYSFARGIELEYTPAFFFSIAGITKSSQVKKISDSEVEISLPAAPLPFFLDALGVPWNVIYDSTVMKQHATAKDKWATNYLKKNAAGYGPYTLENLSADGSTTVLAKNDGYWGTAHLDKITLSFTSQASDRVQLLLSGQTQLADDLPYTDLKQISTGSSTKVTDIATPGFMMIGMDNSQAPYNDQTVRQAMATALDVNAIIKSAYDGYGQPWQTLLPPYFQAATNKFWTYTGGAAAAKKLLGDKAGTKIALSYNSSSQTQQAVAILVQSNLNAAGFDCQLNAMNQATYDTKRLGGELPCWLDDVNTPAISNSFFGFRQLYAEPQIQTVLHYKNAAINAVADKLATTTSVAAQNALIEQGQKLLVEQLPAIPVVWTGYQVPSAKNVTGFRSHSLNILWPKELALTA